MDARIKTPANSLDGYSLRCGFLSGYERILRDRNRINDINVFPVADGDTGNNMVSTLQSTVVALPVTRSLGVALDAVADGALSGARGNSGLILAQYLNGLARECSGRAAMGTRDFGVALSNAASHAYGALENPREGTLLSVLREWSDEMRRLGETAHDFNEAFLASVGAARESLARTKDQLAELRRANVVDAGASGFVSFLEGIAHMIVTGELPAVRSEFRADDAPAELEAHELHDMDGDLPFRYCAEALIVRRADGANASGATNAGGAADDRVRDELMARLAPIGNSIVIGMGREKARVHIHTNDPASLFRVLAPYGKTVEQKVDDMRLQREAVHRPVSRVAIVTDSIADIPRELLDEYQIHVIPQRILWGDEEYLDRLTLSGGDFYTMLASRTDAPGSSVPDPRRVGQVFSWLSSHYASIIAIPVGKAMSGTWQVMKNAAKPLEEEGYPITVLDSRLNSAAQGLVVLFAARAAAEGKNHAEIIDLVKRLIARARIYVSVDDIKYMVRGGRVSAAEALFAAVAHLKPIVTLDSLGHGALGGFAFTAKGARAKILARAVRQARRAGGTRRAGHAQGAESLAGIGLYAVVHAGAPELAASWAADFERALGKGPEYIMEISPLVGMHAGPGTVAVAYL